MEIKYKKIIFIVALLAGVLFLGLNYFLGDKISSVIPSVLAAPTDCNIIGANSKFLKGWAWSSNIGWVSFNCEDQGICGQSNYKVGLGNSGDLSGCAWSSNIGWIRFNPTTAAVGSASINAVPENPNQSAKIDISTGLASGWARACNVFQTDCSGNLKDNSERGGWDGWIKMAGTATNGSSYGVKLNSNKLENFAWGGDVMGWLGFSGAAQDGSSYNVTIDGLINCSSFSANPSTVKPSQKSNLSWNCQLANNCRIDADVAGQTLGQVCNSESECNSDSAATNSITKKTTYTLTCNSVDGYSTSRQTTVNIDFTPTRCEVNPRTGVLECP